MSNGILSLFYIQEDEKSPLRNRIAKHYQDEDETSFNNGEKYKFSLHNSIKEMIFRPLLSENLGKICWKQEKKNSTEYEDS